MSETDTINNLARKKFNDLGLTYKDVGSREFFRLVKMLDEVLPENEFTELKMKVSRRLKNNRPQFNMDENGLMKSGFIKCSSPYFEGREAISFNEDGWIGFAGWADTTNTYPFTTTFEKWCEELKRLN